jgi:hypothetical protein
MHSHRKLTNGIQTLAWSELGDQNDGTRDVKKQNDGMEEDPPAVRP